MTPAAMTPAARAGGRAPARKGRPARNGTKPATRRPPRSAAHPRPVRAPVAPSVPRRVSGPVRPQPDRGRSGHAGSRVAEFIRGLPDHALLDRLVRGRAWIPVLGVMLAGIVAMQVEVLKLNASMGRSIALASSLQTRNELLRTSVSSLSDAQRIERLATRMGMVMPGPTAVDFLHGEASPAQVAAGIRAPDAAVFDSALQASNAQAGATATSPTLSPTAAVSATGVPATTGSTATGSASATSGTAAPTAAGTSATTPTAPAGTGVAGPGTTGGTGAGATGATGAGGPGGTATTPGATSGTSNPGGAAPAG